MIKDENDELHRWEKAMKQRGMFGRRTQQDRAVVEVSTVEEWVLAVKSEFGLNVTNMISCQTDPPDCHASF